MTTGHAAGAADLHAAIPEHTWMLQFPADRKRFIHLHGLAGLNALAAQNALARIVAVEGIGHIHFIGLGLELMLLVLDIQGQRRVVYPAVLVVVIAYRAIEHVIAKNHIEGFRARILGSLRFRDDFHPGNDLGSAGTYEFAIHFDYAGIAGLDRPHQGRVITDVRNLIVTKNRLDKQFTLARCNRGPVNRDMNLSGQFLLTVYDIA